MSLPCVLGVQTLAFSPEATPHSYDLDDPPWALALWTIDPWTAAPQTTAHQASALIQVGLIDPGISILGFPSPSPSLDISSLRLGPLGSLTPLTVASWFFALLISQWPLGWITTSLDGHLVSCWSFGQKTPCLEGPLVKRSL